MYIKDLDRNITRLYGTNQHDSLVISDDGTKLYYYNMQNGCSSEDSYRFVTGLDGFTPDEDRSLVMLPYHSEFFTIGGFNEQNLTKDEAKNVAKFIYENILFNVRTDIDIDIDIVSWLRSMLNAYEKLKKYSGYVGLYDSAEEKGGEQND